MSDMKRWVVDVVETVATSRTYVVEAPDVEQARAKAAIGHTLNEWDAEKHGDVVSREVFDLEEESSAS